MINVKLHSADEEQIYTCIPGGRKKLGATQLSFLFTYLICKPMQLQRFAKVHIM